MDSLIQRRKRSRSINMNLDRMVKRLVSITGDSALNKLFPHVGVPTYVWINPEGNVAAITEGSKITAENIESALDRRSEEHTSELQSLMRISYAVFCLKKKTKDTQRYHKH